MLNEYRNNPRLRLGIWVILAILTAYVILFLSDLEQSLREDYRQSADRLAKLEVLARQKEWTDRAEAAKSSAVQAEGRLWKAGTRGMAQAKVQSWADRLLKDKGITDARSQAEPARDVPGYDGVWQVSVRISGGFDFRKLAELLHSVETNPKLVTVEQLDVASGEHPRFVLVVRVYFQAGILGTS
ncbi:hypothetical protein QUF80_20145 [Desulfococcaceae bacterium HSG8]|nr:hypothetical protein [Desulfococcaceae bacterium HSG8]